MTIDPSVFTLAISFLRLLPIKYSEAADSSLQSPAVHEKTEQIIVRNCLFHGHVSGDCTGAKERARTASGCVQEPKASSFA